MRYLFQFLRRVFIRKVGCLDGLANAKHTTGWAKPKHFPSMSWVGRLIAVLGHWSYIAVMVLISAQIVMFAVQPAQAAPEGRILKNPPLLKLRQEPISPTNFLSQPAPLAAPGYEVGEQRAAKEFDLEIKYVNSKISNPRKGEDVSDNVRLRGYVGTDTSEDTPYVAPTIEVNPGDTVHINLKNNLPIVPDCKVSPENVNKPHCFNGTNLHTHGLWISPTGNSDNVLLSINPGEKFQYEFNIPQDHPAGTFWYHPHRHGSTALQVASGMVGALIVRGDRKPERLITTDPPQYSHGDIDTLLAGLDNMPERILVLQQIQYACRDQDGAIKVYKNNDGDVVSWVCYTDDTGEIESYDVFGTGTWEESGRYTSINGEVIPTIGLQEEQQKVVAGQIERWRMIHAGVRSTISLQFKKKKDNVKNYLALSAKDTDPWIEENCPGDPIDYYVIADDGLTRSQAWETNLRILQPGYRSDALVVFPEAGDYCVIDTFAPASGSVTQDRESRKLLAVVHAEANQTDTKTVKEQLINAAMEQFQDDVADEVIKDLEDDLKLSLFTPHPDITDEEVANTKGQQLAFTFGTSTPTTQFQISNTIGLYFDPKSYDPNRIDRKLKLGDAEEWTLQSYFSSHPFHIHVNPFQIVKILNPEGKDVSCREEDWNTNDCVADGDDPQYTGLKGVWKDTLWVKSLMRGTNYPEGVYTIVVRTRYQRYIGDFVTHCHILDHEDQGMMQNVSIVLPSELYK